MDHQDINTSEGLLTNFTLKTDFGGIVGFHMALQMITSEKIEENIEQYRFFKYFQFAKITKQLSILLIILLLLIFHGN